MQKTRIPIALLLAGLFFVINPHWACSPAATPRDFEFGAKEVKDTVLGKWEGTVTYSDGKTSKYTLELQHAPSTGKSENPLRIRCTNRQFLQVASACVESTHLGLKGTFTTEDKTYDKIAVTGQFEIVGLVLKNGYLNIKWKDNKESLSSQFKDGAFQDGKFNQDGKNGTFTISRSK